MTSSTSGSSAVLSMTVVPGAIDAAMIRFSVPVCEGVSKYKCAPRSRSALMWMTVSRSSTIAVMEVQGPGAQVASADALDGGLAEPVQQGWHEQHGGTEPAGDLGRQDRARQLGRIDDKGVLSFVELHHGANRLSELDGPAHVLDDRDVPQDGATLLGQQRRCDHLQSSVLGTLDEHCALQRAAASDDIAGVWAARHLDGTPVGWLHRAHALVQHQGL